jgi:hypothetical protein
MDERTDSPARTVPGSEAAPAGSARGEPVRPSAGSPSTQEARTGAQAVGRARRVSVTDPIAAARRYDYADAFELRLDGPDPCSPEEWVRAGVDATPTWIKRIAGNPDGLGSVRIVESGADVVVLEDSDPLMDTVMVGRNVGPGRRVLTTVLRYRRPLVARAVWAVVGMLHRRTARRVVAGGLRQGDRSGDAFLEAPPVGKPR